MTSAGEETETVEIEPLGESPIREAPPYDHIKEHTRFTDGSTRYCGGNLVWQAVTLKPKQHFEEG